jgi:hypothetical protein
MNDFVAVFLVLIALAAAGNFASGGGAFQQGCTGSQDSWVKVCR